MSVLTDIFKLSLSRDAAVKQPSLIKDILKQPDDFLYTISVEDDELVVSAKRKDSARKTHHITNGNNLTATN